MHTATYLLQMIRLWSIRRASKLCGILQSILVSKSRPSPLLCNKMAGSAILTKEDLTNYRYCNVSYGMNCILKAPLRTHVLSGMGNLYEELERKYGIKRPGHTLKNPMERYGFNFEVSDADTDTHDSRPAIKNKEDLIHLFLKQTSGSKREDQLHMPDLLILLTQATCFMSEIREAACRLQNDVFKYWMKGDFDVWTDEKYEESFDIMITLIRALYKDDSATCRGLIDQLISHKQYNLSENIIAIKEKRIHSGPNGNVWEISYPELGQGRFAMKEISISQGNYYYEKRQLEEKVLKTVAHPGIVVLLKSFKWTSRDEIQYLNLVFDLSEDNLKSMLQKHKRLSMNETLRFAHQMAKALLYLHKDMGIVHRDIKPSNILVFSKGSDGDAAIIYIYKLCDFGSVLDLSKSDNIDIDVTMSFDGSVKYMAPEMRDGDRGSLKCSAKVDAWSAGATILECIFGYSECLSKIIKNLDEYKSHSVVREIACHLLEVLPEKRKHLYDKEISNLLVLSARNI